MMFFTTGFRYRILRVASLGEPMLENQLLWVRKKANGKVS